MYRSALFILLLASFAIGDCRAGADMAPVNVAIWHPLSLHPDEEVAVGVNLSLLRGKVGSVHDLDLAGLVSEIRRDMRGFQFTGLAGVVGGDLEGVQAAGFAGVVGGRSRGAQVSGLANVVGGGSDGLQVGGLANVVGGHGAGIQIGGFANAVGDGFRGIQGAGFASAVGGDAAGIQVGGFANAVAGGFRGIQGAGFANVAGDEVTGIQVGGFANVAGDGLAGIQIGGFVNASGGDAAGIQIAGFANVAGEEQRGLQVGVVNAAGVNRGVQIGLLNKAGRQAGVPIGMVLRCEEDEDIDAVLYCSNLGLVNVGAKFEVNGWYSMLSAGWNNLEQEIDASLLLAWHFGRHIDRRGYYVDIDLGVMHIDNETLFATADNDREAMQGRLIVGREFDGGLKLFAGGGLTRLHDRFEDEGETLPLYLAGLSLF